MSPICTIYGLCIVQGMLSIIHVAEKPSLHLPVLLTTSCKQQASKTTRQEQATIQSKCFLPWPERVMHRILSWWFELFRVLFFKSVCLSIVATLLGIQSVSFLCYDSACKQFQFWEPREIRKRSTRGNSRSSTRT